MEEFYVIKIVNKKVYLGASDNSNSLFGPKRKKQYGLMIKKKQKKQKDSLMIISKILIVGKLFHYGLTSIRWKK